MIKLCMAKNLVSAAHASRHKYSHDSTPMGRSSTQEYVQKAGRLPKVGVCNNLECMKHLLQSMLGMSEFKLGSRHMEQELGFRALKPKP